jgi:hypothetical protein
MAGLKLFVKTEFDFTLKWFLKMKHQAMQFKFSKLTSEFNFKLPRKCYFNTSDIFFDICERSAILLTPKNELWRKRVFVKMSTTQF